MNTNKKIIILYLFITCLVIGCDFDFGFNDGGGDEEIPFVTRIIEFRYTPNDTVFVGFAHH